MAKAYSKDLRERVIKLVNQKKSYSFISNLLGICTKTIGRYVKRYNETGNIESTIPKVTRPTLVDYKDIKKYIEENPDKTQKEIAKHFGYKEKAMWYILPKLDITYKKRDSYMKKEMKKREKNS